MIIGPSKYSKDKTIIPDSIVVTLPVEFFADRGWDYEGFNKMFYNYMAEDDALWNYRLTNLPTKDVAWVYLVYDGKFQFRTNLVQIERNVSKTFGDGPTGEEWDFPNANWLILSGPAIVAPEGWEQKGFQGFRYAYQLF